MTKDELKLVLEALKWCHGGEPCGTAEAIAVIEKALAQPVSSHGNAEDLYVEMSKHLNCPHCGGSGHIDDVAQPEQKPVAWLEPEWGEKICPEVGYEVTMTEDHPRDLGWIPLTPPQRTWQGLTAGEILDALISVDEKTVRLPSMLGQFACAIEAKLKEKNNG